MYLFRLAVLLAALFLGACAYGPKFSAPEEPPSGYANLVLYRTPTGPGSAWGLDFKVDDKLAGRLDTAEYTRILVKAGDHVVKVGQLTLPVSTTAGSTYFVRLRSDFTGLYMAGTTPIVSGTAALHLVASDVARRELYDYRSNYTLAKPTPQRWD